MVPSTSKSYCSYTIKNVGDDTLKIFNVKPGCGCTSVPNYKKVLVPGDSTEVELIFDSGHSKGSFRKSTQILTNDTTEQRLYVTFGGTIVSAPDSINPVSFSPMKIEFDKAGDRKKSVKLMNHGQDPISVTPISTIPNLMGMRLANNDIEPGRSSEIEFEWLGEFGRNDSALSITFQMTNSDEVKSRFTIPLVAKGTNPKVLPKEKSEKEHTAVQNVKTQSNLAHPSKMKTPEQSKASGKESATKSTTLKTIEKDTTKAVAK